MEDGVAEKGTKRKRPVEPAADEPSKKSKPFPVVSVLHRKRKADAASDAERRAMADEEGGSLVSRYKKHRAIVPRTKRDEFAVEKGAFEEFIASIKKAEFPNSEKYYKVLTAMSVDDFVEQFRDEIWPLVRWGLDGQVLSFIMTHCGFGLMDMWFTGVDYGKLPLDQKERDCHANKHLLLAFIRRISEKASLVK